MAYARGRFGVEYHPRGHAETHRLRWFVALVVALVLVAFTCFQISHRKAKPSPPRTVEPPPPRPAAPQNPPVEPRGATGEKRSATAPDKPIQPPKPQKSAAEAAPQPAPLSPDVRRVLDWIEKSPNLPTKDRVQLERLAEAERQGKVETAIAALSRLYREPTMAHLQDALMRRLGDLNLRHLLSGATTTWTAVVKAKRGDSRDRIAREHRTTPTAVARLNPGVKWEKLQPGDAVRVLDYPSAVLVVYKQRGYADLSLKNGQFFRRYDLSISKAAPCAVYPIASESGATAHARLRELGARAAAKDRAEIEMFLAPGSRITVAE
ncbi:MAG: LysM peptidoglycan-binding domain-containing protein [Kiritimatiellia bacterium]